MIIHGIAAGAAPVAYAGGLASSSRPGFGAALEATLAALQATRSGTARLVHGSGPGHPAPAAPTPPADSRRGAHRPLG